MEKLRVQVRAAEERQVFRINRRTDYAVRVMLSLAKRPFDQRISTRAVQEEMLVPRPYLQRIVADLARAGLIRTSPGPHGGLQLARSAESISLRQVWEAIEGPLLISDCLKACGVCPLDQGCPVRSHWGRLQGLLAQELESLTLAQLAVETHQLSFPFALEGTRADPIIRPG